VQEKKIATNVQVGATYPDGRYANVFVFFVTMAQGHTVEEIQKALDEVLFRVKTQRIPAEVLNQAKLDVRGLSYRRLETNTTLAEMLALYTAAYGDWRKLFTLIDDVRRISDDDIIRVAQRYFTPVNRTTVYTTIPGAAAAAAAKTGDAK
jgi:predicted Zn-dependent peptidase